jgi:hypothetical protein
MNEEHPLPSLKGESTSPKNGTSGTQPEPKKRVTFLIPDALDQALEIYCSGTGQLKNEIAIRALADYLSENRNRLQEALDKTNDAINRLFPSPSGRARARHGRA